LIRLDFINPNFKYTSFVILWVYMLAQELLSLHSKLHIAIGFSPDRNTPVNLHNNP